MLIGTNSERYENGSCLENMSRSSVVVGIMVFLCLLFK